MTTNTPVAHAQEVVASALRESGLSTPGRLDAASDVVQLLLDAGWAPPSERPTPATAQQLQQAALEQLPAVQTVDGTDGYAAAALQKAQVYATLAVAAAVREANADSALRAIANGLNELRVTV